jgi:hypothetical protein
VATAVGTDFALVRHGATVYAAIGIGHGVRSHEGIEVLIRHGLAHPTGPHTFAWTFLGWLSCVAPDRLREAMEQN